MSLKKFLSLFLAILLCVGVLSSCGLGSSEKDTTVIGGPDAAEELIKVGDLVTTVGEFRYYVLNAAFVKAYATDPNAADDLSNFDWDKKGSFRKSLAEEVLEEALEQVVYEGVLLQKTAEKGVTLSEEEKGAADEILEGYFQENGEEAFLLTANTMGISSREDYKSLFLRTQAVQKAEDAASKNLSKYLPEDKKILEEKSKEKVTAKHILILSNSEKFPEPEKTIKEVLKRAQAGENFDKLIEEYNEDPGATETGYTFGRGEMVKAFEDAAFALDFYETSDVVQTEYGYHIIKRFPGLAELQNFWMKNAAYTVNDALLEQISVQDIVKTAIEAQKKLQEQNKSKIESTVEKSEEGE